MNDLRALDAFLETLTIEPGRDGGSDIEREINAIYRSRGPWTVWINPPWKDFTREIAGNGYTMDSFNSETTMTFPDGALLIRSDVNFWLTAVLPRQFETIPLGDIVKTIWPGIENPTHYPDDGDIYWQALSNQDIEVPGEPYELWVEYPSISRTELSHERLAFYANESALAAALMDTAPQNGAQQDRQPENRTRYYGMIWKGGTRMPSAA